MYKVVNMVQLRKINTSNRLCRLEDYLILTEVVISTFETTGNLLKKTKK